MSSLTSSGQISLGDVRTNRVGSGGTNISLKTESEAFASASRVGDIDGNPANIGDTADRNAIRVAPHSLSEFYGANFPSSIITGITFSTAGSDTNTVDGENLGVTFTTDGTTGDYTVRLMDSGNVQRAVTTRTNAGSVTFSSLDLVGGTFTPQVQFDQFNIVNDDSSFTHHDGLANAATALTNATQNVDTSDESVSNLTLSASADHQTEFVVAQSVIVGGDGGDISTNLNGGSFDSEPLTGPVSNIVVSNTPGQLRFTTTHAGQPNETRNNATSTVDLIVTYNAAIDDVATFDTSNSSKTQFNSGDTIRIKATSEGVQSKTMRMGFDDENNNTNYIGSPSDKSISDTRFVRSEQTFDTSRSLTSGTSLETFFPKANYTDGSVLSAGSSFSVAPAFSYNTPGDTTINVNQTRALDISSIVGNNVSVAITSSPDKGSGTNTATLSPGTLNDVYTITYTGTANFSQTSNQTDTITVNPTVSVARSAATGNPTADTDGVSISSTSHGISPTTFTFTPTAVGTSLGFTYSMASGFSFTSGNANTAGAIQGTFNSAGSKSNSLQVASNGTSATDGFSVTLDSITKDFDSCSTEAVNDGGMRAGGVVDVTLQVDFVKRAKLQRQLADSSFEDITGTTTISHGGGLNQSGDTTFTLLSNATPDGTQRTVRIVDVDRTANTIVLPNNLSASSTFTMLAPLAVVNSFSASAPGTIGRITISWNVSNAKTTSGAIVIKRSTASNMSGATTILTTTTAAGSHNDDSLAGGTTFYYQLTALNNSDEATNSSIVNATTPLNTVFTDLTIDTIPYVDGAGEVISDVFSISLSDGTGNTTVTIDDSTINSDLQTAEISLALSTSDTTPDSFSILHDGSGNSQTLSIGHTTGNLFFAFKIEDSDESLSSSTGDDAFTMSFTNNGVTKNVGGTFRFHDITSSDTASSVTFTNNDVDNSTIKFSDEFIVTITGCSADDQVVFTASRTGANFIDLDDFKLSMNTTNGTDAYNASGVSVGTGAQETAAVTTSTSRDLTFTGLSAGTNTFTGMIKAVGDGSHSSPFNQSGTVVVKATYSNTSGNTISNQTVHTFSVDHNVLI